MDNYFTKLNAIDVNGKTEKKNGLTYLSWAFAWGELKKVHPDATYTIYENKDGWFYHTDGKTAWVKTGVTVNGIEHIEMLPVMDYRNSSIPLEKVTSFEVNKAIQRSLTKAVARHGIGLYIYAGEDLPEQIEEDTTKQEKPQEAQKTVKAKNPPKQEQKKPDTEPKKEAPKSETFMCSHCGHIIGDYKGKTALEWVNWTKETFKGEQLCGSCGLKRYKYEKEQNKHE